MPKKFFHSLFLSLCAAVFLVGCPQQKELALEPPSYTTPEATFKTWKNAVRRLDIEGIIGCYSRASQGQLRKEIGESSPEGLKAMQSEAEDTDFQIQKIVYEENTAYIRVQRKRGDLDDIEVVNMIRENGLWKLVP